MPTPVVYIFLVPALKSLSQRDPTWAVKYSRISLATPVCDEQCYGKTMRKNTNSLNCDEKAMEMLFYFSNQHRIP